MISTFPADDPQSRFINERVHANCRKDGNYSAALRMWGGLTNSRELRAIAEVVEKYSIPTGKITAGQRIDLLGVKKEMLPLVWRDLRERGGLISDYAYADALRSVKTCVGKEWCRFGLQESTKHSRSADLRACQGPIQPDFNGLGRADALTGGRRPSRLQSSY